MSPSSTTRASSTHVGAERPQILDGGVVRGRGAAAQDARLGQQHRAGADRLPMRRPAAWRSAQRLGDDAAAGLGVGARAGAVVPAAARDEHEVGVAEHAVRARSARRGRSARARRGSTVTKRVGRPRLAEHLERAERVEVVEPVEQQDLDRHGRRSSRARGRSRRVAGMPMSVTILPMHRDRRARARRGRPARSRDPAQVFGTYRETPYECRRVRRGAPGRCARAPASTIVAQAGPGGARDAPTRCSSRASTPHLRARRRRRCSTRCARRTRAARAWSRSAPARSRSPPPGVLDGRRATTHWRDAAEPRRAPPARRRRARTCSTSTRARCSPAPGVAAGLDLCLHILRRDHGAALADTIARRIVVAAAPRRRPGAVRRAAAARRAGGSLAATRAWALERLHEPLTVRALAAHAHVSERTFARRFHAETGVPRPALAARPARRRRPRRAGVHATPRSTRSPTAAASAPPRTCASTSAAPSRRRRRPTGVRSPDLRARRLAPQQRGGRTTAQRATTAMADGATHTIQSS